MYYQSAPLSSGRIFFRNWQADWCSLITGVDQAVHFGTVDLEPLRDGFLGGPGHFEVYAVPAAGERLNFSARFPEGDA
jgi:hypothetical protein